MKNIWSKINISGVKGILLDLDNTVYVYEVCDQYAVKVCYIEFKKIFKEATFENFKSDLAVAKRAVKKQVGKQASSHSRLLYFQNLFENQQSFSNINLADKFENLYWKSFFKKMVLLPGVVSFLEKCRNLGVVVCVVSDLTAKIQFSKIRFLKLTKYITWVVTSEEAGVEKPAVDIFKLALKKMELKNSEVMVIGDNYERDVLGAKKTGIKNIFQIVHN